MRNVRAWLHGACWILLLDNQSLSLVTKRASSGLVLDCGTGPDLRVDERWVRIEVQEKSPGRAVRKSTSCTFPAEVPRGRGRTLTYIHLYTSSVCGSRGCWVFGIRMLGARYWEIGGPGGGGRSRW